MSRGEEVLGQKCNLAYVISFDVGLPRSKMTQLPDDIGEVPNIERSDWQFDSRLYMNLLFT